MCFLLRYMYVVLQDNMDEIKSFKFLPLMYQLCARMDTKHRNEESPVFQRILYKVIIMSKLAKAHVNGLKNLL